ncbi:MAG: TetR/AcrR family transcriptional regulator [Myxococcota bacterium]|jgi:TetR/AcrR family transcriptional regulator|nr:TetR/AcrR family transcriptional regulator [bacterium]MDP6076052.1 TetR/AcrR family transcriptional regulator [Myxococcota bacterium]MDP6243876.1 TetR/AcrR family transcriptional regulator [Myxococcota bacterium]MDP7075098.1 TetR/AcrR family transcriptional regulator [Myxococcota bacterium]MDP7300756.1 TetR/AcrR family transcriptional regulator [Myxococcota bacterium]
MPMGQPRAEKTRNAILAAAEELFAERGFDATRLEDIAERVGIRRASIVYYFKEKREVYDAIIADVLHGLHGTLEQALTPRPAKPLDRVEAIVAAWANYVGGRPATARLLLREIANTTPGLTSAAWQRAGPLEEFVRREFTENSEIINAGFEKRSPIQVASTVVGATFFFIAAMPRIFANTGFDPTTPEQIEAHRHELTRIVRRLLQPEPTER